MKFVITYKVTLDDGSEVVMQEAYSLLRGANSYGEAEYSESEFRYEFNGEEVEFEDLSEEARVHLHNACEFRICTTERF